MLLGAFKKRFRGGKVWGGGGGGGTAFFGKRRVKRKTTLISTYVFSGLAMVQVLIFGAVLTFEGYDDKAEAKILQGRSLLNLVLSVDNALLCMFQRVWT